ncbi:MAG: glutamate-5-semialdehyde dehydrogenase [Oscillospiraceae bacterium]|nr:glutamate-5-semialdehyde dehydrogenase [Oscillospiraceae bacterium]
MTYIEQLGENAKAVKSAVAAAKPGVKNYALECIADKLRDSADTIIMANEKDLQIAADNAMPVAMRDRLMLNKDRIYAIARSIQVLIDSQDPVGLTEYGTVRPNGLRIAKTRVPLGVIGMIYESRPNVTVDAAALCLKSGNAVILRGGKEAFNSNKCLADLMREAVRGAGLPEDIIQLVEKTDRETAKELMRLQALDLLIPRGGAGLIASVVAEAKVPVIETGVGNCHIYVDQSADIEMAVSIAHNAKTSRPSVCNAAESLLVHEKIADKFLPAIAEAFKSHGVEMRCCERSLRILPGAVPASEDDYAAEFLDFVISVKIVEDTQQAIAHIAEYGTNHSEAIVTNDLKNAEKFTSEVDAAAVYVNASTRFTDGGEFGCGAEIGIATGKASVRGPMGLNELTTVKYIVNGQGQIR